jgi:stalled ribosome rescue protein Dom34
MNNQTAVWIDGSQARIFHVRPDAFDESTVESPNLHVHRHPKDQLTRAHGHPDDEHHFFHDVASHLAESERILLLGPSVTKLHFLRYLRSKAPTLEARIVGVETVGHPTDRQIAAHVREYFQHAASGADAPS